MSNINKLIKEVVRNYNNLGQGDLANFADNTVARTLDVDFFKLVQPPIVALDPIATDYRRAYFRAINGSNFDREERDAKRLILVKALDEVRRYFNFHAPNVAYILRAGLVCKREGDRKTATKPLPPQQFVALPSTCKTCALIDFSVSNDTSIQNVISEYALEKDSKKWSLIKQFKKKGGLVQDLPSGETVWIRLRAIGAASMESLPTEAIAVSIA